MKLNLSKGLNLHEDKPSVIGQEPITPETHLPNTTPGLNMSKGLQIPFDVTESGAEAYGQFVDDPLSITSAYDMDYPENLDKYKKWLEGTDILELEEIYGHPRYAAAEKQSGWYLAGAALTQAVVGHVVGGTISGFGALLDPVGTYKKLMGTHVEEWGQENVLARVGDWIMEQAMTEWTPIYQTEAAEKGWAPGDATWWASMSPSMFSTLSLLIPTTAVARGVGYLGKLTKLTQAIQKTKYGTEVLRGVDILGRSLISRTLYTNTESVDTFKTAYDIAIQEHGMKHDEALEYASVAATHNFRWGYANIWQDVLQWGMILRGPNIANRGFQGIAVDLERAAMASPQSSLMRQVTKVGTDNLSRMGKFSQKFGQVVGQSPDQIFKHGLLQGFEEYNIQWQKKEGQRAAQIASGMIDEPQMEGFWNRIGEHTLDRHTWDSAFWGFMGGLVFGGVSGATQRLMSKGTITQTKQNFQTAIKNTEGLLSDMKAMAVAISKGDKSTANLIISDSILKHAKKGAGDGTLELMIDSAEQFSRMSDAEIENLGWAEDAGQSGSEIRAQASLAAENMKRYRDLFNREMERRGNTIGEHQLADKKIVNEYKLGEARRLLEESKKEFQKFEQEHKTNFSDKLSPAIVQRETILRRIAALNRYKQELENTKSNASKEILEAGGYKLLADVETRIDNRLKSLEQEKALNQSEYSSLVTSLSDEVSKADSNFLSGRIKAIGDAAKTEFEKLSDLDKSELALVKSELARETWQNEYDTFNNDTKAQETYLEDIKKENKEFFKSFEEQETDFERIKNEGIFEELYTDATGTEAVRESKKDLVLNVEKNDGTLGRALVRFDKVSSDGESIQVTVYNEDGTLSKKVTGLKKDGTLTTAEFKKWGLHRMTDSSEMLKRSAIIELFKQTYEETLTKTRSTKESLVAKISNVKTLISSIESVIKGIETSNLKTIQDIKAKNIGIDITDQNREFLQKLVGESLENETKLILEVAKLQEIRSELETSIPEYEAQLTDIEQILNSMPQEYTDYYPEKTAVLVKHLQAERASMEEQINALDESLEKLDATIEALNKSIETLQQGSLRGKIIGNIFKDYGIKTIEDYNNLDSKTKAKFKRRLGVERTVEQVLKGKEDLESKIEKFNNAKLDIEARIGELVLTVEELDTRLVEPFKLSYLWNLLYKDQEAKKTPYKGTTLGNNIESTFEAVPKTFSPAMKPFVGDMSPFLFTTTNEQTLINNLNKDDKSAQRAEPQLLFQRFIDSINDDIIATTKLRLFNKEQILSEFADILTEEQKAYFNESFMATGVFVIPVINGKLYTADSVLRPGEKSVVFSTMRESAVEIVEKDGNIFVKRGNNEFIDAKQRIREYTEKGWDIVEATAKVKEELQEIIKEYEETVRKPVLDGETLEFSIEDINPGKYLPTEKAITVPEALGIVAQEVDLVLASKSNEAFGNKQYPTIKGHVYLNVNNRIVPLEVQTLQEQDINNVVDILKYIAKLEPGQKAQLDEAIKAIGNITYFLFETKGKDAGDYRFFITESKKALTTGVQFGENFLSKSQLLSGDPEVIAPLINFLRTKRYQINKNELDRNETIVFKKVDSKTGQLVDSSPINYKEWLLNHSETNPAKLRTYLPVKSADNTTASLTTPGIINRSVKIDAPVKSAPEIKKKAQKAVKKAASNAKKAVNSYKDKLSNLKKSKEDSKEVEKTTKEVKKGSYKDKLSDVKSKKEAKPATPVEETESTEESQISIELFDALSKKESAKKLEDSKKELPEAKPIDDIFSDLDTKTEEINDDDVPFLTKPAPNSISETMDFESESSDILKIFPDLDIREPENRMLSKAGTNKTAYAMIGFSRSGRSFVRSYKGAPKGSLWHEAGHEWMRRHITAEERIAILEEVATELGSNVYTIDGKDVRFDRLRTETTSEQFYNTLEEFLMEDFRNYVMAGNSYKFGEASIKRNFFQRLLNQILDFLKDFTGIEFRKDQGVAIVTQFERIMSQQWTEDTVVTRPEEFAYKLDGYSVEDTNILVQHLNAQFFDFIFQEAVLDRVDLGDLSPILPSIYNRLYNNILSDARLVQDKNGDTSIHRIILNNWNELSKAHTNFLRQYRIQLEIPETIREDNKLTKDNSQYLQGNLVSVKDNLSTEVKLLIASLPGDIKQIHGFEHIPISTTVDFAKTLGLLHEKLSNLNSVEEMMKTISEMVTSHPNMEILLDRLGFNLNGEPKLNMTEKQLHLLDKFHTQMHKHNNDLITGLIGDEGGVYTVSQDDTTRQARMLDRWKTNIKRKSTNNIFKLEGGRYALDPSAKVTLLGKVYTVSELLNTKRNPLSIPPTGKRRQFAVEFMDLLGIQIPTEYNDVKVLTNAINYFYEDIRSYMVEGVTVYSDDIFDRQSIKIRKELNILARELSKLDSNFVDNQIITSKGTEYSLQLKARIHKVFDALNSKNVPEELKPFRPVKNKDGEIIGYEGNLATHTSVWYDMAMRGESPEIVTLRNLGKERGDKIDIDNLKPGDLLAFELANILEGTLAYPRSEGRSMEYAANFGSDYIKPGISKTQQREVYKKYLLGEVLTAIAYKNSSNSSRFINTNNIENLSFFREILPSELINKLSEPKFSKLSEVEWISEAEKFITDNQSVINKSIENYIQESQDRLVDDIINKKLVIDVSTEKGKTLYDPIGFSESLTNRLKIRRETHKIKVDTKTTLELNLIDRSQLEKLANLASFYYTTAGIEFTKLVTGDLTTYTKGKVSSFHKRTTTFTSTISASRNGAWYNSMLNKYAPRLDGTKHSTNRRTLVFKDLSVESPLYPILQELFPEENWELYKFMNEADGQTWATLDGYRSAAKRTGIWNEKYDRTWVHEAQLGYKLLMENEINNKVPDDRRKYTPEKFIEFFKKHLPKEVISNPNIIVPVNTPTFYKGIRITTENLKGNALPVLKLQGTGQIITPGLEIFNKQSITKTSIAPLLPSVIKGSQLFNLFKESVDNGIDMLSFESAEKGEKVGNLNRELPSFYTTNEDGTGSINSINNLLANQEFLLTEVSWSDIGNQLDIDPAGKNKVTDSSQKRSLNFVDVFNNGEAVEGFEQLSKLFREYTNLQNILVTRAKNNLLDRLGITSTKEGLTLSETEKLLTEIHHELDRRLIPDNLAEGVDIVLKSSLKLFDTLPNKRQLVNMLQSLFRNNAISIKRNGDMLTQVASTGLESSRASVSHSNELLFYRLVDSEGNTTNDSSKAVRVLPAQAQIALPKSLIEFVNNNYKGLTFEVKLEQFNEDWKLSKFDKIRNFVANRIPGQHINSIEVFEITKFLSPNFGSTIVLPSEIVAKSGSDFDIDKLTSYFNNFRIDNRGNIIYSEYLTDKNSTLEQRAENLYYNSEALHRIMDVALNPSYAKDVETARKEIAKLKQLEESAITLDPVISDLISRQEALSKRISELKSKKQDIRDLVNEEAGLIIAQRNRLRPIISGLENLYSDKTQTIQEIAAVIKNLNIEDQNTTNAVENRLNEISIEATLFPANYKSLMKPNDSRIIREQANKLNNRSEEVSMHSLLELGYNMDIAENQWSALSMVGILAVNTTSHSKMQSNPIKFSSDVLSMLFEEFSTSEGDLLLGYTLDQESNKISETNSSAITAAVDAGKETFPALFRINYTTNTANSYQLLNRVGMGETTPMGFKQLTEFFTSPVVMEFERLRKIEESKIIEGTRYRESKKETALKVLGLSGQEHTFLYEHAANYLRSKKENIPAAKQNLSEETAKFLQKYGTLKASEYSSNKLKTLEAYLYYTEMGKLLHTVQDIIRPDTGLPKDRDTIRIRKIKAQRLRDLGAFDNTTIDRVLEESFIKSFSEVHDAAYDSFKQFDLSDVSTSIENLLWAEGGIADIYTNPELSLKEDDITHAVQKVRNALITALIHVTPKNGKTLNSRYSQLFQGNDSVAKRVYKAIQHPTLKDNYFLNELLPVINEFIERRGRNADIDYLKVFNRHFTVQESNAITESIRELMEYDNPEVNRLVIDVFEASLLQSGIQISPTSFFEVLPSEIYQPMVERIFKEYLDIENQDRAGEIFTEQFLDQIMSNLRFDTTVIPRFVPYRKGRRPAISNNKEEIYVPEYTRTSSYPYISVEISNLPRHKQNSLKKQGKSIPKEVYIYKDTGIVIEETNPKTGKVYKNRQYNRIPNYGDSNRFFEVYGDTRPSIIKSNDVGTFFERIISTDNIETQEITKDDKGRRVDVDGRTKIIHPLQSEVHPIFKTLTIEKLREVSEYLKLDKTLDLGDFYGDYTTKADLQELKDAYNIDSISRVIELVEIADIIFKTYEISKVERELDILHEIREDKASDLSDVNYLDTVIEHYNSKIITEDTQQIALFDRSLYKEDFEITPIIPTTDFKNRFDNLSREMGWDINSKSQIYFENNLLNSVEMFTFVQQIQEFINGNLEATSFNDGLTSFVLNLIPDSHPLKKLLFSQIENTMLYRELYDNYVEKVPINQIKAEAVGLAVEVAIAKMDSDNSTGFNANTAWIGLKRWMKSEFKLDTPLKKAAYSDVSRVMRRLTDENIVKQRNKVDPHTRAKYFHDGEAQKLFTILDRISISNHVLSPLANHLRGLAVDNIDVVLYNKVTNEEGKTVAGRYLSDLDSIQISETASILGKGIETLILHEVIHSMSVKALTNNSKVSSDFKKLYDYAKSRFSDKKATDTFYGLKNEFEFMSELFTNAQFIKELQKVPATGKVTPYRNLMEQIFDFFLDLLGINRGMTLYDQAFGVASHIIHEDAQSRKAFNTSAEEFSSYIDQIPPAINQEVADINIQEIQKVKESDTETFKESLRKNVPMFENMSELELNNIVKMIENGEIEIIC